MSKYIKGFVMIAFFFLAGIGIVFLGRSITEGKEKGEPKSANTAHKESSISYTPGKPVLDLQNVQILDRMNEEFANLTAAVLPAVVSISTNTTVNVPKIVLDRQRGSLARVVHPFSSPGLGSGVIVSKEGHIVTNYHVVNGVDQIEIILSSQERFPVRVIGSDSTVDIAVLQILGPKDREYPALPWGDADQVRVGEMVIAVGNPFGLNETVTRGIISARERRISDASFDLFQTDTVINPGNSGGPLINLRGEVIGINVAIYSEQQEVKIWQGVGLAIPSGTAKAAFQCIMDQRPAERGYLGLNLESNSKTVLGVVPHSPAERAGIRVGDVIEEFNGAQLQSSAELIHRLKRCLIGTEVPLKIRRNGKSMDLLATIEKLDSAASNERIDAQLMDNLGFTVRDLTPEEKQQFGASPISTGILINEIRENSTAAKYLKVSDVIHKLYDFRIHSKIEFIEGIQRIGPNPLLLMITRGQKAYWIQLRR